MHVLTRVGWPPPGVWTRIALAGMLLLAGASCGGGGSEPTAGPQAADETGPDGSSFEPSAGGGEGAAPSVLPTFSEVNLYSADSPLNRPISQDPAIDPDSDAMVRLLQASGELVIQVRQYSSPVYIADASTPRRTVELPCGPWWELGASRMTGVPIPDGAEPTLDVDGSDNPVPPDTTTCGENADQDNNLIVLDLETRCEYDLWQFRWVGGQAVASWGGAVSLDGTGIYPGGLSTRGSGFAFLGGLIWPDELQDGRIEHALVFNYPYTRAGGPVAPATATDGVWDGTEEEIRDLAGPGAVPMPEGARLQLDPELDLDTLGLTSYERTIARALQKYGMFLVDTGGGSGIGLYAIDPRSVQGNPYEGVLPDGDFVPLPNIPMDRFRVLETGEIDLDWQTKASLSQGACATFE